MRVRGCFRPGKYSPVVIDHADRDFRSSNIDRTDHEFFPSLILIPARRLARILNGRVSTAKKGMKIEWVPHPGRVLCDRVGLLTFWTFFLTGRPGVSKDVPEIHARRLEDPARYR
jgi:hypothetical protein